MKLKTKKKIVRKKERKKIFNLIANSKGNLNLPEIN